MTRRYKKKVLHVHYSGKDINGEKVDGEAIYGFLNRGLVTEADLKIIRDDLSQREKLNMVLIHSFQFIR